MMLQMLGWTLMLAGSLVFALAGVGVWRLRDVYARASALSTASGLGAPLLFVGIWCHMPDLGNLLKLGAAIVLWLLTSAVGSLSLARAAYLTGSKMEVGGQMVRVRIPERPARHNSPMTDQRVLTASLIINAPAEEIFELIAQPSRQPEWDGNDNLQASDAPRITAVGDVFVMHNTSGKTKENHVVAFTEGREIAWLPADAGQEPSGHRWGWQLVPLDDQRTEVTHIYDFTALADGPRLDSARRRTAADLLSSIERLKSLAEA